MTPAGALHVQLQARPRVSCGCLIERHATDRCKPDSRGAAGAAVFPPQAPRTRMWRPSRRHESTWESPRARTVAVSHWLRSVTVVYAEVGDTSRPSLQTSIRFGAAVAPRPLAPTTDTSSDCAEAPEVVALPVGSRSCRRGIPSGSGGPSPNDHSRTSRSALFAEPLREPSACARR